MKGHISQGTLAISSVVNGEPSFDFEQKGDMNWNNFKGWLLMLILSFRGLEGNYLGNEWSNSCRQLLLLESWWEQ